MSGVPSIKLGEDMIQNIKIAFRSQKPVTVIYKQVYCYNRNEGSYSTGYKWTTEKTAVLFNAIRGTLPPDASIPHRQAVVANGMGMLEKIILKGSPQERKQLAKSDFIVQLREDAAACSYPMKRLERLLLRFPSSALSRSLLAIRKGRQIISRYLKRHILKH